MWPCAIATAKGDSSSQHDRIGGIYFVYPQGVRTCLLLLTTEWFT